MADSQEQAEDGTQAALTIDWSGTEDAPTYYANNMVAQYGQHEGYLIFFEIVPPVIMGTPEDMKAQIEKLKSVRAKCKARIIIPKELLPKISAMLQDTVAKVGSFEQVGNETASKLTSAKNSALAPKSNG